MQRVLLVGAGKIGGTIASFLSRSGDYDVLVADADDASLRRVARVGATSRRSAQRRRPRRPAQGSVGAATSSCRPRRSP
jgi:3-hydroxyacyl-CoA dehydrogenase